MYAVIGVYCLGLGLLRPSIQGLMSTSVPENQQGLLQGALTSLTTITAIPGPPLANGAFAVFIDPRSPLTLPGPPFFMGSVVLGRILAGPSAPSGRVQHGAGRTRSSGCRGTTPPPVNRRFGTGASPTPKGGESTGQKSMTDLSADSHDLVRMRSVMKERRNG
jgi:hypothetical protein